MKRLANCAAAVLLSCTALFIAAPPAAAGEFAEPTGDVILTVSGAISNTNGDKVARFDRAMLEALGLQVIETSTPWDKEAVRYEGVLGRTLLEAVGASGDELNALALNDYAVTIPVSDFRKYDVIIALKRDGKVMRVREKGPIFVVYPFDRHPELHSEAIYGKSIWQLKAIEIR